MFFHSQSVVIHFIHVLTIVLLMVVTMITNGAQLRRKQTENMLVAIGDGVKEKEFVVGFVICWLGFNKREIL